MHAKALIDSGKAERAAARHFNDKEHVPPLEIEVKVCTLGCPDKTPLVNAKDVATNQALHGWETLCEFGRHANTMRRRNATS